MEIIRLNSVELSYPIYSMRAHSIRNAIANIAVGGKLLRDGKDIIHVKALDKVSFSLNVGDRLGIVGHNGSGKTTLLKVLAGVYEPDRGVVSVAGNVSSMIDVGLGLDASLTGMDNILNMGRMRGLTTKQILSMTGEIVEFSELGGYIDLPVKTYSAGMQARLVFAVATTLNPDILLLDEWIGAGDVSFHNKATQRMADILDRSRALVLASHDYGMIKKVCNKLLVLNHGVQTYFGDVVGWNFDGNAPLQPA